MSYARFSEGDVYMFSSGDVITCMCCLLTDTKTHDPPDLLGGDVDKIEFHQDVILDGREEALEHLEEHLDEGHQVPDRAIDRLENEIQSK